MRARSFQNQKQILPVISVLVPLIVAFIWNFDKILLIPNPFKKVEILIKSPESGQLVSEQQDIIVVAKNIEVGQKIWIVVHPSKGRLYFPNLSSSNFDVSTGQWTSPDTEIGGINDSRKSFDVYALLTDIKTQNELHEYANDPKCAGLSRLPDAIYAKITVIRK